MMVAASMACGRWCSAGVSTSVARRMPAAVNTPAAGVCAPASKLTTEREKPPVTGRPPVNAADRLLAPRATSSWSGTMRWRRLAASVCPTDTDSTKPTTLSSKAGTASCCHSARSHSGSVNGGRPCGMWPTTFTPWACQSKAQAMPVVTAMAATGPALVSMSATRGARPSRTSSGFKPLRTQNRKAVVPTPSTSVSPWVWGSCRPSASSRSTRLWPSARTPISVFSWLAVISSADAVMKPEITGWLRKLARKPSRSRPMASSITPDMKASVRAAAQYAGVPAAASWPMAAAVISDVTAAGPTASARLVPNTAYSSSGATLAYRPTSAGRPASSA